MGFWIALAVGVLAVAAASFLTGVILMLYLVITGRVNIAESVHQ